MTKIKFSLLRKAALALASFIAFTQGNVLAETVEHVPDLSGIRVCAAAELNTLTTVIEKDADIKMNVAGLARLPVLLYVCEAFDCGILTEETEVTVSEEAAAVSGPTAFLRPFERIKAGALLKASVMILAGDAITALAESAGGTPERAALAVNDRMEQLGLSQRVGAVADSTLMFSAKDLLILGKALAESPSFCGMSGAYLDEIMHENGERTELVNQNRLLRTVSGCFGLATGSSAEAGYCGLFGVKRGETAYLCVVIGTKNAEERHSAAKGIIEHAFAEYRSKVFVRKGEVIVNEHPVQGGTQENVNLIALEDAAVLEKHGEEHTRQLNIPEWIAAPVSKTESVGTLDILNEKGEKVLEIMLYPAESVEKAVLSDHVQKIMRHWVHG